MTTPFVRIASLRPPILSHSWTSLRSHRHIIVNSCIFSDGDSNKSSLIPKCGIGIEFYMPLKMPHTKFEAISSKDVGGAMIQARTHALLQICTLDTLTFGNGNDLDGFGKPMQRTFQRMSTSTTL